MANGADFVDWLTFNKHIEQANVRDKEIQIMEAELMGDERTGRPSLRTEMISENKKTRKTMIVSIALVLLGMLAKAIFEYETMIHAAVK